MSFQTFPIKGPITEETYSTFFLINLDTVRCQIQILQNEDAEFKHESFIIHTYIQISYQVLKRSLLIIHSGQGKVGCQIKVAYLFSSSFLYQPANQYPISEATSVTYTVQLCEQSNLSIWKSRNLEVFPQHMHSGQQQSIILICHGMAAQKSLSLESTALTS